MTLPTNSSFPNLLWRALLFYDILLSSLPHNKQTLGPSTIILSSLQSKPQSHLQTNRSKPSNTVKKPPSMPNLDEHHHTRWLRSFTVIAPVAYTMYNMIWKPCKNLTDFTRNLLLIQQSGKQHGCTGQRSNGCYPEVFKKGEIAVASFVSPLSVVFLAKYCYGCMKIGPTHGVAQQI